MQEAKNSYAISPVNLTFHALVDPARAQCYQSFQFRTFSSDMAFRQFFCLFYFVRNKTRFTFSPIELKSKFLSLSAFIHWLPKEGVDRTSGLKKILSLQRFWRIVSSLIKWSSHKHDWFSCKSVAQAIYYIQFYYRRREMLISCWLPLW